MLAPLVTIGVAYLVVDSGLRYARLRRTEGGPFFGSARAPHLLFVLFVLWIPVAIVFAHPIGNTMALVWFAVASVLAAGMVASERRRTAVRSRA